jgi:flagellin
MTSILTNTNAMTALQVLATTNRDLSTVQAQISTGKKVGSAKDNAATWAVSQVMSADVAGFKTLNENLGLASSAVSVARTASESVTDLLKQMKEKIVAAQDGTQDRAKIQADIDQLKDQIKGVTASAQFNGLNYMKGTADQKILASLDRSSNGDGTYEVASNFITFKSQDLAVGEAVPSSVKITEAGKEARTAIASVVDIGLDYAAADKAFEFSVGGVAISVTAGADKAATKTAIQTALDAEFGAGQTVVTADVTADGKIRINDNAGRGISEVKPTTAGNTALVTSVVIGNEGQTAQNAVASKVDYTFNAFTGTTGTDDVLMDSLTAPTFDKSFTKVTLTQADGTQLVVETGLGTDTDADTKLTMKDIAANLQTQLNTADGGGTAYTVSWDAGSGKLSVTDADGRGVALKFEGKDAGKLGGLDALDVQSDAGAKAALKDIEGMIQSSIDAAASLGSIEKRLNIQSEFLSKLSDSLTSGIGTLVDADITSASARLQALQVQQQLGTQALSIANQQPQMLMRLFG